MRKMKAKPSTTKEETKIVTTLTDEQIEVIITLLADFDASALTETNALDIVAALEEAEIQPGHELAYVMEESGFDAREIGELAEVIPISSHSHEFYDEIA